MSSNRLIPGTNDLASTNPELIGEWHPIKNGTLKPCDIAKGSIKKVWWLGKCGHEWMASPNDRTNRPRGCPYCSGNRVLVGFNDLATTNPELAKEWHPTNNSITPEEVSAGSEKKVWWLGKCGHEWQASIKSRNNGRGCPYCSNAQLLRGFNDLATRNPELAAEWHPSKNEGLAPQDVIGGTHQKVWWKCSRCGHEWQATCNSRNDSEKGCPRCSKKDGAKTKVNGLLVQWGSLLDNNPALAAEWHPTRNGELKPSEVMAGSDRKAWWLGKCGHEWRAIIKDRNKGAGCPICANLQLLKGFNDLETKRPDLAKEWHPTKNGLLLPCDIVSGYSKKVWWKCNRCGHEWQTSVIERISGKGCPKCSSELNTSYPEQAVYYYLKKIFPDAINRYVEMGKELDIFLPQINVGIEYDGYRYHTIKTAPKEKAKDRFFESHNIIVFHIKESKHVNKVEGRNIIYRATASYNTLDEVIRKLLMILEEQYDIKANIAVDNKADMPTIMSNYYSSVKANSIPNMKPELLSEWNYEKNNGLNPEYVSINSNKKVWWKCNRGHEWQAVVYTRAKGSQCPYCTNKKVLSGFNDLKTLRPDLMEEWHPTKNIDLNPSELSPGSSKKAWWICEKGHEWQAEISSRNKGHGCPYCNGNRKC